MKSSQKLLTFEPSKKNSFFVCMYKMDSFALFTANTWRKNDVEVVECGGNIWINQGHLQGNLVLQILLTEL